METPGHTPDTGKADHRTSCIGPLTSLFTRLAALQEISGAQKYFVECTVFLFVPKFMDIYWRDRGKADYRTFCWGSSQSNSSGTVSGEAVGRLPGTLFGRALWALSRASSSGACLSPSNPHRHCYTFLWRLERGLAVTSNTKILKCTDIRTFED